MFAPIYDDLVMIELRKDRLREAEKDRLIRLVSRSSSRSRQSLSSVFRWLDAQATRLRCVVLPSSASQACTP
jgi:hypothetical protein